MWLFPSTISICGVCLAVKCVYGISGCMPTELLKVSQNMTPPTATEIMTRGRTSFLCFAGSLGSSDSTSRNSTSDTISILICVSARSGALYR